MNTNKNFEKISSENLNKTTGGVGILPTYSAEEIEKMQKQVEEEERKRKLAEKMVSTGIHGDPPIAR